MVKIITAMEGQRLYSVLLDCLELADEAEATKLVKAIKEQINLLQHLTQKTIEDVLEDN